MNAKKLAAPYRVRAPRTFRLAHVDPADTDGVKNKEAGEKLLAAGRERLRELQEMLYAQDRWSLLLVFQALDAAGKDGTIKHVMSGVNPTGCQVFSFKQPSEEELDHDFLWRCSTRLPERGRIGIFNRSYYEEVLVVRVHPPILAAQQLPPRAGDAATSGSERFEDIKAYERYLARNGTVIRKFFLHVSKEEQKRRFLERIDEPEKNWKFSPGDVDERAHWDDYMHAYEDAIRAHERAARARGTWCRRTTSGSRARSSGRDRRGARGARPAFPEGERGPAPGTEGDGRGAGEGRRLRAGRAGRSGKRGSTNAARANPDGVSCTDDGVDDGARTRDTRDHNPVLCQLSYIHHAAPSPPTKNGMRLEGIEPPTDGLEIRCSILLSYRRTPCNRSGQVRESRGERI